MNFPAFVFIVILGVFCSCNPKVDRPHIAVFATVEILMRDVTTHTGFFTTVSLYDSKYEQIEYKTSQQGNVYAKNNGSQDFIACRYDPVTYKPIWVATGGGIGGDGGCNYYTVPPENAVYVVGYFEGEASFPIKTGLPECKTLTSHGMADMFIAKYAYDSGELQWLKSGGSPYADIVFTDNLGARHKEVLMTVDSVNVTVYTNFFGRSTFDGKTIEAKLTGSAVQISYDKASGEVQDVRFVTTLPNTTNTNQTK